MKVLITGGHFSPAYSLIPELLKRGHEVAIVGRRHALEGDRAESYEYIVSQKENIPFFELRTGRLQRKLTSRTFTSILKVPVGLTSAVKIISNYKPDIVLTFGGYIGFPVSYAAKLVRVPVVLHEQTQNAGVSAKLIGKVANKICVSFIGSENQFPGNKVIYTGNPVRKELFEIKDKIDLPKGPVIYITGGSTGSHFINSAISEIIDKLLDDYVVIHQTGDSSEFNDFEKLNYIRESLDSKKQKRYILRKYIYPTEIGFIFKSADLILSRAGANTITEILAARKISLLIPLPHGQYGEQLSNARLIKELGAGEYIEQKNATTVAIYEKIREMLKNAAIYKINIERADQLIIDNAAEKIADVVEEVYGKKNS